MQHRKAALCVSLMLSWFLLENQIQRESMADSGPLQPLSIFYVSRAGSDTHDGLSPDTAWKSISRVNAADLEPGDKVLFRRGDVWQEMLSPADSGTAERPITYGAYGTTGPLPRISGTAATLPAYNAIRNAGFEEYKGSPDDGLPDQVLHYAHAGGICEIVSDAPAGSEVALRLQSTGTKAQLSFWIYLPANLQVTLNWQAKSLVSDGAVAVRHRLEGPDAVYLQDDLQTWSTAANWDAAPLAGAIDGGWSARSLSFRTDGKPGAYQLYLMSGNSQPGNDTSYIADLQLLLHWQPYSAHTYRLPAGYAPRRIMVKNDDGWQTVLDAAEFGRNRDSLEHHEWVYDAATGYLFLRDDNGTAQAPTPEVEISFPQTPYSDQCGILVNVGHIAIDSLAVTGWPFENPVYEAVSGVAITANATDVSISNCLVAHNFRIGIGASHSNGAFADNVIAYNGGTGLLLHKGAQNISIRANQVMYNGYWGLSGDDGEGIALGTQSAANLVEYNDVHHNNRHPESWNHGAIILYESRDNIVRYNRVYDNYKAGVVIDGQNNQFYYNLVYNSGLGYARTDAWGMCNLQLRNDSQTGAGGNRVWNNVFYGGTANRRWMGNIFVKAACTDSLIQNNVFWGFVNEGYQDVQIRVDSGTDMTGTVISDNLIGPQQSGFIHYLGVDYDSLIQFESLSDQVSRNLSNPPQFSNPSDGNFYPLELSPLIDAGLAVGLSKDLEGITVDDPPNIGAFERALSNVAPKIAALGDKTVAANQTMAFYVLATDDNGDRLTLSARAESGFSLDALGAEFTEVLYGDLNADQKVDPDDLQLLLSAYNSRLGHRRYNPFADLNSDGVIDFQDLGLQHAQMGATAESDQPAGRFSWTPTSAQADLTIPLTIVATDTHNAFSLAEIAISVTSPIDSPCAADFNGDGAVDTGDLSARSNWRRQDHQQWQAECFTPGLDCADIDGNRMVDDKDRQAHAQLTWDAFERWVRECWQPDR